MTPAGSDTAQVEHPMETTPTFWQRLGQNRLLDVTAMALAAVVLLKLACLLPSRSGQNDFAHYYASSRLLIQRGQPYGVPLQPTLERLGFSQLDEQVPMATNPPPLIWLFVPLALLPPALAFYGWVMVQAGCLVAVFWLTRRLIGDQLSRRGWRLLVAATLASPAVYWHFYYSQVQLLLAVLVLLALWCLRQQRPTAAALAVATAGLLKLFPFVLLPWVLWTGARDRKQLIDRSLTTLSFIAAGFVASGPRLWAAFATHARGVLADWATCGLLNYTVPSLVLNTGRILMLLTRAVWLERVAWPLGIMAGLALIGGAYAWCFCSGQDKYTQFSLLSLVMLAGGPTAWVHYQVLLIFPVAWALASAGAAPWRRDAALLAPALFLLFCHGNAIEAWDLPPYIGIWLSYGPLYGILLLAVFFARRRRGDSKRTTAGLLTCWSEKLRQHLARWRPCPPGRA